MVSLPWVLKKTDPIEEVFIKISYFCNSFANSMDAKAILQTNGLSKTKNRVNILYALEKAPVPLSGKEISWRLSEQCDRSTIYRTLNSLYEKDVLLRIIIDHEVKYALKIYDPKGNGHYNDHIHFKCSKCEKLFCFKEIEVKDYQLPEGFIKEENQFLVIGICKECQ
ncbi:MAG: transcriptional repressor [Bacteroidales bacterium]|nr:transcriptional repressor [Bacteroidales bacterium]